MLNVTGNTRVQVTFKVAVRRDFNNDGKADLVFQNNAGQIGVWYSGLPTDAAFIYSGGLGDWRLR